MTNLGLNKKIATIKNFEFKFGALDCDCGDERCPCYNPPPNGVFIKEIGWKRWSESIVDAWELFEEMPYEKLLTTDRYSGSYSGGDWICGTSGTELGLFVEFDEGPCGNDGEAMNYWSRDKKDRHLFAGSTAAEAICLAWIAWKEK